ncbi:MAG: hypothetical protein KatS3mg021_1210 [Fimbriimonadales bacterium]|nr:MAG: hypothetical protein KatS3mg021_1210 [Fimbriimonadales bacterium]
MRRSLPPVRVQGARRGGGEVMNLDSILPHFPRALRQPDGSYMVNCPAHDDRTPSLHLTEKDGRLLWHCHAGCPQEAVGEALRRLAGVDTRPRRERNDAPQFEGCTLQQLADAKMLNADLLRQWGVSDGRYGGVDAVRIPYQNEQGETVSVQWRVGLSGERFRRQGSPALYGLWRLSEYSGANLWCVEGVSDLWTLWHAGLPALGFPNNNPPDDVLQHFWNVAQRFANLYIIPDGDAEGAVLLRKLAATCPPDLAERVRVVSLPDGHKDANNLWQAVGGDADAFKAQLRECVAKAQPLSQFDNSQFDKDSIGGCQTCQTCQTESATDDELTFTPVSYGALETETAEVLVPNFLHAGRLTLFAGIPGVGKSIFALELADALECGGTLWGRVPVPQCKVLWLDFDDPFARLKEVMETYYGSRERNIIVLPHEQLLPLSYGTYRAYKDLIQREGVGVVVVDTLLDWVEAADANDESETREKMNLIRALAKETGAAFLCLHHPRKESEVSASPTTTAVAGSIRWAGKADTVALLRFDSRGGEDAVLLSVPKCRDGQKWQARFLRQSYRFVPCEESNLPASEWRVVKDYLQQVGEATYADLMDTLTQAGFTLTERTLRYKIARWRNRGMVLVERRGFPAVAFVKLPTVHITTPAESSSLTNEPSSLASLASLTRGIESGCQTACQTDDADFHALLETLSRPDDDFALDEDDLALMVQLWTHAKERNFPRIELPEYDLHIAHGRASWLSGLSVMAGTSAVPLALQRLTLLDARATAHAPTHTPDAHSAGTCPDAHSAGLLIN